MYIGHTISDIRLLTPLMMETIIIINNSYFIVKVIVLLCFEMDILVDGFFLVAIKL